MPLDPKLRTTMVQAFAVTVEAPGGPESGRPSVSVPIRVSDRTTQRISDPGPSSDAGRDSLPGS